jgi:putative ABC transport system ATP-binding protein
MIELLDIRKVFNMGKPNEFVAIRGINLSIDFNKVTVFRGPSGSGKTTLLSIIGCMASLTGELDFRPGDYHLRSDFIEIRQKTFGFIFQQFNLIKGVTALENAMLPAYPSGEKHASLKKRALHLFDLFNISQKAASKIEWLSGGEAQRVTIVRSLINNPSVVIADEPTAHLDTTLSQELMEIVARLKEEQKTVLIASHDPIVYESSVIDRVINFRDGSVEGST